MASAEELIAKIREILTAWNYGPSGIDRQTILAIHDLVGDDLQPAGDE